MDNIEKMLNGKIYDPVDPELRKKASRCHDLCTLFNASLESDQKKRKELIDNIFPHHGENIYIQGNVYVDYGEFTIIGDNFYANYGLTILDTCPVKIGNNVYFGPYVSIYTPLHPLRHQDRNCFFNKEKGYVTDKEYGKPITIGDNCWLAGGVSVLAGVTIGEGCVIGAGSVVTRDIPPFSLAAGNPCKVIRKITEEDRIELKKELW